MAKILLADDSGTAQRMGSQILSAEGHEVNTVSNGQAAIKILGKFAPDLIVADVFMPGKSGYELCEHIKSNPDTAWIPVLLIVAPMEPYDATEGKRVKADGLVTKPLDKSNLVETVQALLASSKRPASAPKKRGAKAAAAKPELVPEPAELHELPAEEDPTIPSIITNTAQLQIEIPEEMKDQPVSLIGELLEPSPEPAPPESSVEEELVIERSSGEEAILPLEIERDNQLEVEPLTPIETLLEPDVSSPEVEVSVTETEPELDAVPEAAAEEPTAMDRLFSAAGETSPEEAAAPFPLPVPEAVPEEPVLPEPLLSAEEPASAAEAAEPVMAISDDSSAEQEAASSPEPSWTAEAVEVSKDDRELFGPSQPDWQGLVDMVQQEGEIPATSLAGAAVATEAKPEPPPSPEPLAESSELPEEPQEEPQPEAVPASAAADEPPPVAPQSPAPSASSAMNDTIAMLKPQVAPLDYATVEQIVRETIEEIMPQIVDRISRATGIQFPKNGPTEPKEG